jgi:hypothetical protein
LKTHKKASYREIEMLRVALYLVAEKAAAIAARDITAAIIPSKALTKHTHTHVYPQLLYENGSSIYYLSNGTVLFIEYE